MRYYVLTDVHAFYKEARRALTEKGYFSDTEQKKIIICGDLFDRGKQVKQMEKFILELLKKDEVILIRGNHEDLMLDLVNKIDTYLPNLEASHHFANGTLATAMKMSGMKRKEIEANPQLFVKKMKESAFLSTIIPSMIDYFETDNYVFVHGWIPCYSQSYRHGENTYYKLGTNWRLASPLQWSEARWYNGMAAARCGVTDKSKTIVCGHYRTSWGHCVIYGDGDAYGPRGNYSPYYNDGIIALDACTTHSKIVNCLIIDD